MQRSHDINNSKEGMMWDQRYSEPGLAYGAAPNDFLREQFSRMPMGRVLCIAEGQGRNAVFLAAQGYDVSAVDSSAIGLECAQALAKEQGVELVTVVGDLEHYPIEPGAWQGIVSIFCHIPVEARIKLHRQVVQGLAPGGVFILEAYTEKQLEYATGGPPVAELMLSANCIADELQGLDMPLLQELDREIIEGKYHTGQGAVVQCVAVKAG